MKCSSCARPIIGGYDPSLKAKKDWYRTHWVLVEGKVIHFRCYHCYKKGYVPPTTNNFCEETSYHAKEVFNKPGGLVVTRLPENKKED